MRYTETLRGVYLGKEQILVLGDSHTLVFDNWRFRLHLPQTQFKVVRVNGATVSGMANPNSKTQARATYDEALANTHPTKIITLLGEVDVGFVIWYRAKKYGHSIDEMLELAVKNYEDLLTIASQRAPVIAISCPLPTIQDGQTWGQIANLRKEVDATRRMRTDLTLRFNSIIERITREQNCSMVSLDSVSLEQNNYVTPRLLNANPLDFHYSKAEYAKILAPRLARVLHEMRADQRSTVNLKSNFVYFF